MDKKFQAWCERERKEADKLSKIVIKQGRFVKTKMKPPKLNEYGVDESQVKK